MRIWSRIKVGVDLIMTPNEFSLTANIALFLSLVLIFVLFLRVRKAGSPIDANNKLNRTRAQIILIVPTLGILFLLFAQVQLQEWNFFFSPFVISIVAITLLLRNLHNPVGLSDAIVKHVLWFTLLPGMEGGVISMRLF